MVVTKHIELITHIHLPHQYMLVLIASSITKMSLLLPYIIRLISALY